MLVQLLGGVVLPALRAVIVRCLTSDDRETGPDLPFAVCRHRHFLSPSLSLDPLYFHLRLAPLIEFCLSSDIDKQSIGRPFDFG